MFLIQDPDEKHYFWEFIYSIEYFNENAVLSKQYTLFFQKFKELKFNNMLYNTEQLSRKNWLERVKNWSENFTILDYSDVNIKILKLVNPGCCSILFPILFNPSKMLFPKIIEPEYDIIFIGFVSERRKKIIQELENKVNLLVLNDTIFDWDKKFQLMMNSKIILNIHAQDDYQVFEYSRCSIPIYNSKIVVSELSLDLLEPVTSELNKLVLENTIFTDYENIPKVCINVLKNIDKYKINIDINNLKEITQNDIKILQEKI